MSEIKVNKISPRTACGTTTLGDSGDTFTIPAGVSIKNSGTASRLGATGSAPWNPTVKTGDFTAVTGEGYFVNTTSGEIDVTLPAGSAGDVVAVADYANTFDTNNCIFKQNGSDKIEGSTDDLVLNTEGAAMTLVFVDSTKGWIVTDTGNSSDGFTETFLTASGGTETTCGDCKVHTFTGPGTFTVSSASNTTNNNVVSYLVVAGGSGGGGGHGGGGGAGGYREIRNPLNIYTASPLNGYPSAPNRVAVTAQGYPIVVGAGGTAGKGYAHSAPSIGGVGNVSTFSTITSAGGGSGGGYDVAGGGPTGEAGGNGGSGGGGVGQRSLPGGTGNTPPTTPSQGNNGGASTGPGGAGGGGAGVVGASPPGGGIGGAGGNGATTSITGTPVVRGGGGGGGAETGPDPAYVGGAGGTGGGGAGVANVPAPTPGGNGTVNTGGGAGGGTGGGNPTGPPFGGVGGSGIVIIRYKFQ